MHALRDVSRDRKAVFVADVLYLFVSFLEWQRVPLAGLSLAISEWTGIGVVAGAFALALLLWEILRLRDMWTLPHEQLVSVVLALLVGVFTIVTFAMLGATRQWPAWIGLALGIVVAAAALGRAHAEGLRKPRRAPIS